MKAVLFFVTFWRDLNFLDVGFTSCFMIPLNFEPLNLTNFQKHQIIFFEFLKASDEKPFEFSDKNPLNF